VADKVLPTVTDAAVDAELQQYVERATQLVAVDRAAAEGDTAVIDYEGLKDGVAFQGGTAKGYELGLGSHTFIPGFEEQVIGMKAGEEKDINLTFPEEYHAEDLAGQPVVFKVKCIEVKEKQAPAIDDEFAKDVSEFDTLAEFKADLKEKIIDRNMAQSEAKFRQALLAQLCDQIDIELPAAMIEAQIDKLLQNYAGRLEQQGISLETYLQYMQMSVDKIREDLRDPAVTQIKQQMALDAVVEAEKIEVSDEDVDAEVKKAAANMNVPYERIIEGLDFAGLKADLARDRAMDAVATAAKPNMIAAEADNGEIKITEVTKEEVEAEKAEKKAAKKTTKKSEEAAEGEEKKPARKPRAKKAAAEGEEAAAPKKTTRKKKADAEEAKGEE
jgi:trigger factor